MRPRAWRIMMWTSLAATALLVGGAIGGRGTFARWTFANGRSIGLQDGALCYGRLPGEKARGEVFSLSVTDQTLWWWHDYAGLVATGGFQIGIDLWLLAGAAFAVTTLSVFMVYRTRRRPGHCGRCGYDRSGLPAGTSCPECGRKCGV